MYTIYGDEIIRRDFGAHDKICVVCVSVYRYMCVCACVERLCDAAKTICGAGGGGTPCTYVAFPNFPRRLKNEGADLRRWDGMHFEDVHTYKCWTRATLQAMGNLETVLPASEVETSG